MPWWKFWSDEEDVAGSPDYYEEGEELLEKGKYHEALTSFRLAKKEAPEDPAIREQMAVVYTQIGLTDEAIKTYRRALELDARSPASHYGLAYLYEDRDQYEAARRHLEAFLEHPPDWSDAEESVRKARRKLQELREREEGTGSEPSPESSVGEGPDRG